MASSAFSAPVSKTTGVSFDRALPEDISNENFPDRIDSFDFPNANLLDLVKAIGKLTGINFIVDNELKNKQISIIAPSSITVAEAYKAFLSALAVHGYTIVKTGAFWKIQTTEKSHKDNIEVYSGDYFPNTDQLITRIIKLKHINAKDFMNSIKFLLSQNDKIQAHESSNSVILSDYGSVIEKIMKIVYEMDVPGAEEQIEIIQIEHASAEEIAQILEQLLSDKKQPKSSRISSSRGRNQVILSPNVQRASGKGTVKISKIIPDSRTNSLIVFANKAGLQKIKNLIKKVDRRVDASLMTGVYVYNVLYGTADEVYNTLMGIKSSNQESSSRSRPFRRNRSTANKAASNSPLFGDNVQIMADSNTNSLIISADKKYEYERVLEVLKKIDIPRDQVFIQAIIVEMIVDKGDNREFNLAGGFTEGLGKSVDTFFKELSKDFSKKYTGSIFRKLGESTLAGFLTNSFSINSLPAQIGPGVILGRSLTSILEGVVDSDLTSSNEKFIQDQIAKTDDDDLKLKMMDKLNSSSSPLQQTFNTSILPVIRLLKTSSNVNVLSTPQITTLDNTSAFIEVGENAPVGLSNSTTVGTLTQSVESKDITLRLDITPRINPKSGTIQMDIKQKFDDFSNRTSSASELASRGVHIIKRNIETEMVLHDGETAVLGGLLTDKETKVENKVPLLGDLPLVGWLFKGRELRKEKRNLLVFITPTIIKGAHQKQSSQNILHKKIEERIRFIEKYVGGRDPHGELLDQLIPASKRIRDKYKEENPSFFKFKKKSSNQESAESYKEESDEIFEEALEFEAEDFKEALEAEAFQDPVEAVDGGEAEGIEDFQEAVEAVNGGEPVESPVIEEESFDEKKDTEFIPLDLEDLNL